MTISNTLRWPGAVLPLAMSVVALALEPGQVTKVGAGAARRADEGATAHFFQLLIAGQVPLVPFFAIKVSAARAPRLSLPVLALQTAAVFAALAPVCFFNVEAQANGSSARTRQMPRAD